MSMSALKVTPAKLKTKSSEFKTDANQIKNITHQMFDIIKQLNGDVWSGEAAATYTKRFNELDDDVKKMYNMIKEFSDDLTDIANEYTKAETANESTSKSLKINAIS